jgi:redox-sensitive bicupin YhaK (pirin superfamily)
MYKKFFFFTLSVSFLLINNLVQAKEQSMLNIIRLEQLGRYKNEWLNSYHHFNFGQYYDPLRISFGNLQVINDDLIKAGKGFDMHPHRNMEIITYVRKGAIIHKDNLGNQGITRAGNIQVMSAGKGISHSEYSTPEEDTLLYQIWIKPNKFNTAPHWKNIEFPKVQVKGSLPLLISGKIRDNKLQPPLLYQEAAIYGGKVAKDNVINQSISSQAYLLVSFGKIMINNYILKTGDAAQLENEEVININIIEDSELLLIDIGA